MLPGTAIPASEASPPSSDALAPIRLSSAMTPQLLVIRLLTTRGSVLSARLVYLLSLASSMTPFGAIELSIAEIRLLVLPSS